MCSTNSMAHEPHKLNYKIQFHHVTLNNEFDTLLSKAKLKATNCMQY